MAKKFLDNTGLSHLIDLIQGMPDDQTIGYTTEAGLHVLDGGITPDKISSLQQLRYEMGLGNTLGALPIENGGTGLTSEAAIKEWLESLLDLSGGGSGGGGEVLFNGSAQVNGQASIWSTYKLSFTSPTTSNTFSYLSTSSVIRCLKSGTYNLSGSFNVKPVMGGNFELKNYRIGLWVTSNANYHPDTTDAGSAKILYTGTSSSSFDEDIYIGSNQYIMLYGWYIGDGSFDANPVYQCVLLIQ